MTSIRKTTWRGHAEAATELPDGGLLPASATQEIVNIVFEWTNTRYKVLSIAINYWWSDTYWCIYRNISYIYSSFSSSPSRLNLLACTYSRLQPQRNCVKFEWFQYIFFPWSPDTFPCRSTTNLILFSYLLERAVFNCFKNPLHSWSFFKPAAENRDPFFSICLLGTNRHRFPNVTGQWNGYEIIRKLIFKNEYIHELCIVPTSRSLVVYITF